MATFFEYMVSLLYFVCPRPNVWPNSWLYVHRSSQSPVVNVPVSSYFMFVLSQSRPPVSVSCWLAPWLFGALLVQVILVWPHKEALRLWAPTYTVAPGPPTAYMGLLAEATPLPTGLTKLL